MRQRLVQTAFVIAGGILEAEGELFTLVFLPVAFGMEVDILQAVIFAPVSYTHLDVYKRQPSRRWTLDNISSGDFTTIQKSSTKRT